MARFYGTMQGPTMTSSHTPGPWKAVKGEGSSWYVTRANKPTRNDMVAACGEREADARLIAQAHAMLRLAQDVAEIACPYDEPGEQCLGCIGCAARAILRAAHPPTREETKP